MPENRNAGRVAQLLAEAVEVVSPPDTCESCGSLPSVHGGHGRQQMRHGWYSYECGRRWHAEYGWATQQEGCHLRELQAVVREVLPYLDVPEIIRDRLEQLADDSR